MPQYKYTARDSYGKAVTGTLTAPSMEGLADQLKKMGYLVTRSKEVADSGSAESLLSRFRKISHGEMALFAATDFAAGLATGLSSAGTDTAPAVATLAARPLPEAPVLAGALAVGLLSGRRVSTGTEGYVAGDRTLGDRSCFAEHLGASPLGDFVELVGDRHLVPAEGLRVGQHVGQREGHVV